MVGAFLASNHKAISDVLLARVVDAVSVCRQIEAVPDAVMVIINAARERSFSHEYRVVAGIKSAASVRITATADGLGLAPRRYVFVMGDSLGSD